MLFREKRQQEVLALQGQGWGEGPEEPEKPSVEGGEGGERETAPEEVFMKRETSISLTVFMHSSETR